MNNNWRDEALCLQFDPETFFPEPATAAASRPARRVCAQCPVKADCLEDAVRNRITHGIRAGLTEYQLRAVLRKRGALPTDGVLRADLKPCGTSAAYARHRRRGETPCGPCVRAEARRDRGRGTKAA